ncbi:MAG: hypothetical protein A2177_10955 [Spirochaetes bacterium RBG_13_68_11]|nr:MAG: hypothetical protein A2177_10955 [Spirochaetes bacterium RBG_13_68_11]
MVAVVLTGVGHLILTTWLDKQMVFTISAILFWICFVGVRVHRDPSVLRRWGFRREGFWQSARMLLPFGIAAVLAMVGYGLLAGTWLFTWRIFLLLVLYPPWGLVQQFLVVGLLAGNLRKDGRLPEWAIILVISLLFAAIHLPSIPLAIVAGLMVAFAIPAYFKAGNLYALGLLHGWVGSLAYFFVLGKDPLADLIRGGIWP